MNKVNIIGVEDKSILEQEKKLINDRIIFYQDTDNVKSYAVTNQDQEVAYTIKASSILSNTPERTIRHYIQHNLINILYISERKRYIRRSDLIEFIAVGSNRKPEKIGFETGAEYEAYRAQLLERIQASQDKEVAYTH